MVDCPKQQGTKDCGVFAIAIATSLATSKSLSYNLIKLQRDAIWISATINFISM
jgi:Ulp1 family protease